MLPTSLRQAGVTVQLPADNKLKSAMTAQVAQASEKAGETMKEEVAKIAAARAKVEADRPALLKARIKVYNKRAYLKRQAKQLQAKQAKQTANPETPPEQDAA